MAPATFNSRLRADLDNSGVSIAELGRRLNQRRPENGRRSVHKFLAGEHRPRRATRIRVARALGLEPTHYEDEEDDLDLDIDLLVLAARVTEIERVVML